LIGRWTAAFTGQVDYGSPLGKTTGMPPYRLFFAGGPDSVRGYTESRLGPKDDFGNPFGGNLKVLGRAEIIVPTPDKWKASARVSLFYDIGNVFMTGNGYTFVGRDGLTPVTYHFSYNDLKRSAGIAVQWLAPLGVFRFSLAVPLNAYPGDDIRYPDQKEAFQFSVGQAF
jgi:outer membrane protein insertion porin family